MRGYYLIALFAVVLIAAFGAPFAGVLGWTWLSLMSPNKLAFGFAADLPFNLVLAIVVIAGWLVSKEPKRIPMTAVTRLWMLFIVLMTITTFFALNHALAWDRWDKTIKVMALGLLVAMMTTTRERAQALVWIIVLSLGYFGIKGGLFTIITGGGGHVVGPAGSSIADNNYLALALAMTLPLMFYLFLHSSHRLTRIGLIAAMLLTAAGIMGTYSRGGMVGLGVMGLFLCMRSRRPVLVTLVALIAIVTVTQVMPEKWSTRVSTLKNASEQTTFLTRYDAWKVAYNIAASRPLIGGGFGATEDPEVYRIYARGQSLYGEKDRENAIKRTAKRLGETPSQVAPTFPSDYTGAHAVHSIYFQVLADHGFVGLIVFLSLLAACWFQWNRLRRSTRNKPQEMWIHDLASMMQVSMVSFLVAGAAVSMCYYDLFYLLMGLGIALHKMAAVKAAEPQPAEAQNFIGTFKPQTLS